MGWSSCEALPVVSAHELAVRGNEGLFPLAYHPVRTYL